MFHLEVGKTYPFLGGTSITPVRLLATIVWLDGENVHYRLGDSQLVKQTPIDRFTEIVEKGAST